MKNYLHEIDGSGYTKIENCFSNDECNRAIEIGERFLKNNNIDYSSDSVLGDKKNEQVINNLQNKDYFYVKMLCNKKILNIIKEPLQRGSYNNSEPFQLLNSQMRNPLGYAPSQQLHIDSNIPGIPGSFKLIMLIIIMLDDFTEDSGPTRIVPKSNTFGEYAENGVKYDEEQLLTGKRGDVLIVDASLWHGSSEKLSNKRRWSINAGYGRWFIKQSFDIPRGLPNNILKKLNDYQKEILGFRFVPPIDEDERTTRISKEFFRN